MKNIVRTAYGSALQTASFSRLPFVMQANTTLNEKFGVLSGVAPAAGVMPAANYYCIGCKGHTPATGTGGIALVQAVQHVATDAALYGHLPFVLRNVNNDISPAARAAYGLRTQITVSGVNYYAYYLKRIVTSAAVVNTVLQTVTNGVTTTVNFVPSSANLSPTPPVVNSAGANVLASQYINSSATLPVTFTQDECTELLNAATILYGDPAYAIISEIGICSGVDKPITLTDGTTFSEVIATQVVTFISTMHVIQYTATGFTGSFDLGAGEPCYVIAPQ